MEKSVRVHRVGTITTGLCLISFGNAFLAHMFLGEISYEFIFHMWPLILIGLGIELMISNFTGEKVVYDKGAIFLVIIMAFFAMGMGFVECFMMI